MPFSRVLNRPLLLAGTGLGAAILVALLYFALAFILGLPPFTPEPAFQSNIQIVLDRSIAMEEPFGDGTKMEAAVRAIDDRILAREVAGSSNLAFRQFGGPCTGENSQLLVGFGREHQQDVRSALRDIDVAGETTFVAGIIQAVRDFGQADGRQVAHNEIIVIAGGGDTCRLEEAAPRIRQEIEQLGVPVNIRFIGLDVPEDQRAGLDAAARAISGELPVYVNSPIELDEKLTQLMASVEDTAEKVRAGDINLAAGPQLPPIPPTATPIPTPDGDDSGDDGPQRLLVEEPPAEEPPAEEPPAEEPPVEEPPAEEPPAEEPPVEEPPAEEPPAEEPPAEEPPEEEPPAEEEPPSESSPTDDDDDGDRRLTTLTVVKSVTNNHGGNLQIGDFILRIDENQVTSGSPVVVSPGMHTVSEDQRDGYAATFSGACNSEGVVTVAIGASVTCTITNNDVAPTLRVVKQVINDNGGEASPNDFTISVTGSGATPSTFQGDPEGTEVTLNVGPYSVSETPTEGYVQSFSAGCSGVLGLEASATCTITNDDVAPTLILDKVVVNDNGGGQPESAWTLTASGPTPLSGPGAEGNADVVSDSSFSAGTYTLSEEGPDGYTAGPWECEGGSQEGNEITLGLGESATCTITNDDIVPELTLDKVVVNNDEGTQPEDAWTLTASGPTPLTGPGAEGSTDVVSDGSFSAGTYTLSEEGPDGYTAGPWGCEGGSQEGDQITLEVGESATCTIINDDNPPEVSLNPDSGTPGSQVTISGAGFPPATPVDSIFFGEVDVLGESSLSTDSNGVFQVSVTVPELPAGPVIVRVVVGEAEASATFTVIPPEEFEVDNTSDSVDVDPGDGLCADESDNCSLRAAVMETNALPGGNTINLPAGTYTLFIDGTGEDAAATGDLDITDDLTINGDSAGTTIIEGIDGEVRDRVFHILGVDVTVSGVTVQNGDVTGGPGGGFYNVGGNLTVEESSINGNNGGQSGGIFNDVDSTLVITNSEITENTAGFGGGIVNLGALTLNISEIAGNTALFAGGGIWNGGSAILEGSTLSNNTAADGGGIYNGADGTVTLTNSTNNGNSSRLQDFDHIEGGFSGGGIFNEGSFTISNSQVSGNAASFDGAGIYNAAGASLSLSESSVNSNRAIEDDFTGNGGGLFNLGTATVTDSTIGNNDVDHDGAGIHNQADLTITRSTISGNESASFGLGSGIFNEGEGATLTLVNSTVSGNSGVVEGGGIFNTEGGAVRISSSTITGNTASNGGGFSNSVGSFEFKGSIIAGNFADSIDSVGHDCIGSSSTTESLGFNLLMDAGDPNDGFCPATETDVVLGQDESIRDVLVTDEEGNPLLQANGGPTQTHALVSGSLAIDRIPQEDCTDIDGNPVTTDQRGVARPQPEGDACDIGAYEEDEVIIIQ